MVDLSFLVVSCVTMVVLPWSGGRNSLGAIVIWFTLVVLPVRSTCLSALFLGYTGGAAVVDISGSAVVVNSFTLVVLPWAYVRFAEYLL